MGTRFPYGLPSGWFQVARLTDIEPGAVKPLRYFGRDLVLFRETSGAVRLLDAHCPHLGAHLGHGGRVEGDEIVCPFHAWRFDGSGRCTRIPYSDKVPRQASITPWVTVERCGLVFAWHDRAGRPPMWTLPEIPEYGSDEWTPFEPRTWSIRTCNQEMAENAVDLAHFLYLHGTASMPTTSTSVDGPHMHVHSKTHMTTPAGIVEGSIEVDSYGFGYVTTRFRGIVETLLLSSVTAIDEDHVDVNFHFSVKKIGGGSITRGVGKAFVAEVTRQLEQDIPIWENKVFLPSPVLCRGDGPIGPFRRWARQFYPEMTNDPVDLDAAAE